MKKTVAIILALVVLAAALVACDTNNNSDNTGSRDTSSSNSEENTVSNEPSEAPTVEATEAPASESTEVPTAEATETPTAEATEAPTVEATEAPTSEPTEAPTAEATEAPTSESTETPTAEATEAPTSESTEETTEDPVLDREYAESAIAAADEKHANSHYLTVYSISVVTSNGVTLAERVMTDTFAGNKYNREGVMDNSRANITYVDGYEYFYSVEDGVEKKIKTAYTDKEMAEYIDESRNAYMLSRSLSVLKNVEIVLNDDGTTTYFFRDFTEEAKIEYAGMYSDASLTITLDKEGRYALVEQITVRSGEDFNITGDIVYDFTYTYTYYSEDELEITAPEDADEYEEYIMG